MKKLGATVPGPKKPAVTYLPDYTATSIDSIDFKLLEDLGIKHIMFDLDQTLRRPYTRKLHPSIILLLNTVTSSHQFQTMNIVSNNHRDLSRYSKPINARVFQPFRRGLKIIRKPNPEFFTHVLNELNAKPHETVMIGDRLIADILGGNKMGIHTIYVKKRGAIDYWFDWLLLTRLRERRRLKSVLQQYRKDK